MKQVCLINSPSLHKRAVSRSMAGGLGFDGGATMVLPPLELAIMASSLRAANIEVELIDADPLHFHDDDIYNRIKNKNYDVIIATASLPTLDGDSEFIRGVKKVCPDAKVFALTMIGDQQAITQLLKKSGVDLVLHGEVELLLPEIIANDERHGTAWLGDDAPPYFSKPDANTLIFKPGNPIENIDALPFPARDLLPNQKYIYPLLGTPVATLQTSRGCPFPCGYYCPYPLVQGKKFRPQSPQRVFAELKDVVENYNIHKIYFRDATFTLDNQRTAELCDMIVEAGLTIEWMCETRVDRLTDELLEKMQAAGCVGVLVGVETGDETVMQRKEGKKGLTLDSLIHLREKAQSLGIKVHYLLIVGLPHETRESTIATYELIMKHKPDTVGVTIITPYPGTPLFADATREGWIDSFDWRDYGGHQIVMHTPNFSHQDLQTAKGFLDEAFSIVLNERQHGNTSELQSFKEKHYLKLLNWVYELDDIQRTAAKAADKIITPQHTSRSAAEKLKISIIMPTFNRAEILHKTLLAYCKQTVSPEQFEILVVDDGSTDDTLEVVKYFNSPYTLRLFAQQHPGAIAARNYVIKEAVGDVILITGDDMLPAPNFVAAHLRFHIEHPALSAAMVGHIDWASELNISPLMRYITSKDGGQQFSFDDLQPGQAVDYRQFYTSNVSVKREFLLQQEILFDLDFTYPAYDDVELGYRLHKQGMQLMYRPEAKTYHFHKITTESFVRRQQMAGHMATVLISKHPELAQYFMPRTFPEGLNKQVVQTRLEIAAELEKLDTSKFSEITIDGAVDFQRHFETSVLYPFYQQLLMLAHLLGIAEAQTRDKFTVSMSGKDGKMLLAKGVSIVIPVFNKVELTRQCLEALNANTDNAIPFEVIMVDNASTDDTPQFLRQAQERYPNLRVITNTENTGFADACNQGAQAANGEYILFLNNDTEVQPGWLLAMLEVFHTQPNVGVVGSKLLYPDGTIQHAGVIIVDDRVDNTSISPWHFGYNQPDAPIFNHLREFKSVTAACQLVKKSVFDEMGGFDEAYWNGYEDVDFCFKVLKAGYKVFYQPRSVVIHYESQSGSERHAREEGNLQRLQERWQGKIIPDFVRIGEQDVRPNTAVIIVTYNSETSIRTCIDSVLENTRLPVEVVVVDNASADGTHAILAEYGNRINTILNDENLGFSAACNQGIRATEADFVTLLNPDTLVTPGWLGQLIAHFEPDVGAVGPLSDYVAGRQQFQLYLPKERPSELDLPSLMALLRQHNRGKSVETKLLIGFCMVLSRAALDKVGLLDEALFLGNDDLDISWRLRNAGYRLLVATDTFIHHEGQVSFKTEAKSKTNALVQQSTDILYEKLVAHYGEGNVPPPLELWDMDWFTPTNARFREPNTVPADDGLTSIIILVHNQLALTQDCLNSIEKYTPEPHEIIIVDNASTDGTPTFLRQYMAMHRNVRIIRNEENIGFARGNNQALALARGDFVLFLNNDTAVSGGWLGKMQAVITQHPDVGIVGPVSNMVSGPQRVVPDEPYAGFEEFSVFADKWSAANHGKSTEFFRIVGFCMLVRRAVIDRIGGWDEQYDIGNFEDDDFCIRAALAGFKARIAQDVFIHHIGRRTFQELKIDYHRQIDENWRIFCEKWRIPTGFEMGKNYFSEVMAHTFTADDLSVPVPSAVDVLPLEVTAKPASAIVVLNGAEADSPEQVSAAVHALLAQLPDITDAELWVTGAPNELPDGVVPKDDMLTALAEALLLAKTVTLVSADVTFAADGLAQLIAVAESQPTVAAIAPVSDVAPTTHRIELPADDTAWASFAADRYRQYGENVTPVPYLGGFCVTLKSHHARVMGGLNSRASLGDALAELFRQLRAFGFQIARADGIAVRHDHFSAAEGAELVEREASRWQLAEILQPGQTALENNDLETAAREFSNAAAANPAAPEIHAILGSTLLTLGRTDEAIAALKKATELSPGEPSLKNQLGVVYFQAGRTNKAKKLFRAVLAQDAKNLQAHLFLLDLFRMEKRFREAIAHAKSALEIDPENTDVLVAYGLLMLDMDDLDGAEMAWQHLADAPADNPGVLALMKGLLVRGSMQVSAATILPEIDVAMFTKDWQQAVALLKFVLNVPGASPAEKADLWNRLGNIYFRLDNVAEAVAALNAGLELDPQNVNILSNLADVYLQQEQLDRATEYINRVLEINPNDVNTLMLLGNCAIRLQDLDVAQMAFRRVQEVAPETEGINQLVQELAQVTSGEQLEPDTTDTVSSKELLARVEAAQQTERWADAAQLLLDALQSAHNFSAAERVEFLNRLGVSQFMAGNISRAEDALLTALEIKPDDRAALGNLADVFAAQEQFDRATEYLNRALAINPDDIHTLMSLGNCALQLEAMDVAQMAFERVQKLAPETDGVGELVSQLRGLAAASAESPSAKYDG